MRFLFSFLICLIIVNSLKAQNFNNAAEIRISGSFIGGTFRLYSSPQIKFDKNSYSIGVGPSILLASHGTASDLSGLKLTGVNFSYEYFPLESNKNINFYFFDELLLNRIEDKWTSSIYNDDLAQYQSYTYRNIENIIQNYLGYGVQWQVHRNIFLKQSVGIGFYYSHINNVSDQEGAPDFPDENVNGYDPFDITYSINLSLRVRLTKK